VAREQAVGDHCAVLVRLTGQGTQPTAGLDGVMAAANAELASR
jgi:hypothetical protein